MGNPTILIAGATGTNGRELLNQLAHKQIPVRALVRDFEKSKALASELVELVQGDLAQPATLTSAMAGIEKAYIVTGIAPDVPTWFSNFYQAAKAAGVKHIVKFSGLGAELDSPSEIIRQHAISDQELIDSGMAYTILRPNSFHQNMLWQAQSIKQQDQFYLPMADARQSTVDVRDLAEATVKVLTETGHENQVYDLTGPESLDFSDVAKILSQQLGRKIHYIDVPASAAKQSMLDASSPGWTANAVTELQTLFATGKYSKVEPDLAKLLGRAPRSFAQFAQDFASAFK